MLGSLTGLGTGMAASSIAVANLAPVTWWTPLVPGFIRTIIVGGKTVIAPATFTTCTVIAPIALGLTIGSVVFSGTMFAFKFIEDNNLSQFLADVIIASLPMLKADGEVSEEEKHAIDQLLDNPKIKHDDQKRIKLAMDSNDSFDEVIKKNLLHETNAEKARIKHRLLLAITWQIAKADGKINQKEIALHERMSRILDVPLENSIAIRRLITPKFSKYDCVYP